MGLFPQYIENFVALNVPRGPNSKIYLVDPSVTTTGNGRSWNSPFKTLEEAEAATVANQHDAVLYLSGSSGNNLAAALTWDKSYTHLLGLAAPTAMGTRARIFQTSTVTGASPLLTISGSGCVFKNFYIFQGVDDATSLINVSVTGGRNYFENVHFAGGGHATMAINGGCSLQLNGAEECRFVHCTIGVDTVASATGHVGMLLDAEAHRNVFEDCHFSAFAGHTGAAWVEVTDGTGFDRYTIFKNCLFTNSNMTQFTMTTGFVIPAIAGNRPARMFLYDCASYGAGKWDDGDRGVLMGNMDDVTPADTSGVMVEMIT